MRCQWCDNWAEFVVIIEATDESRAATGKTSETLGLCDTCAHTPDVNQRLISCSSFDGDGHG